MTDLPSVSAAAKLAYLDKDRELMLIDQYQTTGCKKSLGQLLMNHNKLCLKIASRYRHKFDKDDTYQDCMTLLIECIEKFDSSIGTPFFSYAYTYVSRAFSMIAIRKWANVTTPGTRGFYKAFRRMGRFRLEEGQLSHADAMALAEELTVPLSEVFAAFMIYKNCSYSLDAGMTENGVPIIDTLEGGENPESIIMEIDAEDKRKGYVNRMMSKLTENEARVLQLRHLSDTPEKLKDVGSILGISAERVRQIESKAIGKLKAAA